MLLGLILIYQKQLNEIGVELRFQQIEWDSKVLELNSDNIYMIWNG